MTPQRLGSPLISALAVHQGAHRPPYVVAGAALGVGAAAAATAFCDGGVGQ